MEVKTFLETRGGASGSAVLFHGTMIFFNHSTLQNYTRSGSIEGYPYPIHWLNGYDIGMLGDVHLQQMLA
jgi:hypothetical protein